MPMIRMIQSQSASHAKAYFSEALSKSDYYVSDQELTGHWQGRLAARLALGGETSKESFFAICENRHPQTGEHLTPRTREDRRVGYDINFHCPKSLSVLHVLAKDDHILIAFQQSVRETMIDIEADSQTRVRRDGANEDRHTGELAWAEFIHQTARPVAEAVPDPHLHAHCFVFNATRDATEEKVKAGQFHDIKRDMPYYQAIFHKKLSDRMISLGYEVERTDKSFEIAGVPKKVIGLFSKRTDEIGRAAKEQGITDAKELAELGARTRSRKQKGVSMAELKTAWLEQIHALVPETKGEGGKAVRYAPRKDKMMQITSRECVDYAVLHAFERASAIAERRILQTAYRHALGEAAVSVDAITQQFKSDPRIIHVREKNQTLCTTKEVLREEKQMVDLAKRGQGAMLPLYNDLPEIQLEGKQRDAVVHVLTSCNRISIIRGAAGAGKTTLMKEAVRLIEGTGKTVTVLAPSANASRGVLKEEGFENPNTVARFLIDSAMQQQSKSQVIWVDEAGLLGTKDMTAVLQIAEKNNARIILGGDTRQHAAVVRGDALRVLNKFAGIKTAEVDKIRRQKNERYRSAIEDLSKGDVAKAFVKLDKLGFIHPLDPLAQHNPLVDDYMAAMKNNKASLIISPTHAQGDAITSEIRARLRAAGKLGKKEIAATRYRDLNFTEAEKSDQRNFQEGHIVQFDQNLPGFKRGSSWTVQKENNDHTVTIKSAKGETRSLPLHRCSQYTVFERNEVSLSKGDCIRITKNGFDANKKRMDNGWLMEVSAVSKTGRIKLTKQNSSSVYEIDQYHGHIAHAHCITSHASQGKTVDVVLIWQPTATFPATDAKQFYVSVSRAKEEAKIYTDDKEALLHHASELRERQSALELVSQPIERDFETRMRLMQKDPARIGISETQTIKTKREAYEPEL